MEITAQNVDSLSLEMTFKITICCLSLQLAVYAAFKSISLEFNQLHAYLM